jgi:hypothetical protein
MKIDPQAEWLSLSACAASFAKYARSVFSIQVSISCPNSKAILRVYFGTPQFWVQGNS